MVVSVRLILSRALLAALWTVLFVGLLAGLFVISGCGDDDDGAHGSGGTEQSDPGDENGNSESDRPTEDLRWSTTTLQISRDPSSGECGFEKFQVDESGQWNLNACERMESGHLTDQELAELDERVETAVSEAESAVCTELLILDEYYVNVDHDEAEFTSFDPRAACYKDGFAEVEDLRNALIDLQTRHIEP